MTTRSSYFFNLADSQTFQSDDPQLRDHHLIEALDYILESSADNAKRQKLARVLRQRHLKSSNNINFEQIESLTPPAISGSRFNYTLKELLRIAENHTQNSATDLDRVMRYALIMCGIRIGDVAGLNSVAIDEGYIEGQRFPRVTGSIYQKRLSMRVVPSNSWGGSESPLWTPFILRGEKSRKLWIGNHEVSSVPLLFLGESINNIAYFTKSGNQYFITANPLQNCSHDCTFCCRAYGNMSSTKRSSLINFTPSEIARYLRIIFPKLDFYDVAEVAFITGVFPNDEYLLNYVELFLDEMRSITNGRFDPCKHSHQRLKISSHLLRSENAMRSAVALGVKRFTYTVELVDAWQRHLQMNLAKPGRLQTKSTAASLEERVMNQCKAIQVPSDSCIIQDKEIRVTVKGSTTFESVMEILERASYVFGQQEVEPVLIIGLDTYQDTLRALERLYKEGYRLLTRSLLNAYSLSQLSLYRMSLPEIIVLTEFINKHFRSAYQPIIDSDDQNVIRYNTLT
jgi:hypothetical protein